MYFIPRDNMLYHKMVHSTIFYRYIITCFIICCMIFTWLYMVYFPLETSINFYQESIKKTLAQHEQHIQSMQASDELSSSIDILKKKFSEEIQKTSSSDFNSYDLFIIDIIKNSELKLDNYNIQDESNKKWYRKNNIQLTVSGTLIHIMKFLNTIKLSEKMIKITDFNLMSIGQDTFSLYCRIGTFLIQN